MVSQLLAFSDILHDMKNYFANFSGATNTCRTVMLWFALALVVAFVVCKFAVKKEKQPLVNKIWLFIALGFAVVCIATFTICYFAIDVKEDKEFVPITFYPLLVLVLAVLASAIALSFKPTKVVKYVGIGVSAAALVAVLVCMGVYYSSGSATEWNGVSFNDVNQLGLYLSAVIMVAGILVLAFFTDKNKEPFNARSLALAGICVALAFALSYVRIFKMPMGGSITLASTLPIMLYSYIYGSKKGLLIGLIYGILQAVQDPWIIHPAQFVLDYGVAFAAIGTTGFVKDLGLFKGKVRLQFALGAVAAGLMRLLAHFFSGAFAFGSFGAWYTDYSEAFNNPYVYSLVYNLLYVVPDLLISLAAGLILLSSKNFVKMINRFQTEQKKDVSEVNTQAASDNTTVTESAEK
jgi:thiamine transporter